MSHGIGTLLFATAIIGNGVVLVVGLAYGFVWILGRVFENWGASPQVTGPAHETSAFHHPDPIQTPIGEQFFMIVATALVLVGLPVALAAIFHFVTPMIGSSWTP